MSCQRLHPFQGSKNPLFLFFLSNPLFLLFLANCSLHHPSCLPRSLSHSPTPKQTAVKLSHVDGDIVPPLKADVRLCSLSRWFPIAIFKLCLVRYPMNNKYGTMFYHVFGATPYRRHLIEKAR